MNENIFVRTQMDDESEPVNVPFMRPFIGNEEIEEVNATLRSRWLTTGSRVKIFEREFAMAVNGRFAVALNSCTAALHLAVEALGLRAGQAVLVPTMTFAATAEIVLYKNAIPVLVDCDPETGNMDLEDAERKIALLKDGSFAIGNDRPIEIVGIIPVHVGGYMLDVAAVKAFAERHGLWIVEDAAHAFPAAWRASSDDEWTHCGDNTAHVTCYSFYANKTITTGEGGMAVTSNEILAERIRLMSLHGLSHDAWGRYSGSGAWDYQIILPGYKYNLTDIAAAIGIHQLARAEEMRLDRERIAFEYKERLGDVAEIEHPPHDENRIHSWHLYPIRLRLDDLRISRNEFIDRLKMSGVGCSVHWRPLHMHPLYIDRFKWSVEDFPQATALWERIVSLPIFPWMSATEIDHVVQTVRSICQSSARSRIAMVA